MSVSIRKIVATMPRLYLMRRKPFIPEARVCAAPECSSPFETTRRTPDKKYCTSGCRLIAQRNPEKAGKAAGDKRRGCNPNRYITVRVNGKSQYLHRVRMAEHLEVALEDLGGVVHHVDRNKHHNCTPSRVECDDLLCFGNLEHLTGEAAAEHLRIHAEEMRAARAVKYRKAAQKRKYGG